MKAVGVLALIILLGSAGIFLSKTKSKMFFTTTDNLKIAYKLYEDPNPKGYLLLTHMMPATKESWSEFAKEMQKFGYESIVIDLRGHGESAGGSEGYKNFSDAEHQNSIKDLEAAWEFLKSRGAKPENTTLIGASIGANLSLQFISEHLDFKKAILLSPGLNYRGVKTEPLAKKLNKDQALVFVTSKDDDNNLEDSQKLYAAAPSLNKHLIIFDNGGHGTDMFQAKEEFDLFEAILKYLQYGSIN